MQFLGNKDIKAIPWREYPRILARKTCLPAPEHSTNVPKAALGAVLTQRPGECQPLMPPLSCWWQKGKWRSLWTTASACGLVCLHVNKTKRAERNNAEKRSIQMSVKGMGQTGNTGEDTFLPEPLHTTAHLDTAAWGTTGSAALNETNLGRCEGWASQLPHHSLCWGWTGPKGLSQSSWDTSLWCTVLWTGRWLLHPPLPPWVRPSPGCRARGERGSYLHLEITYHMSLLSRRGSGYEIPTWDVT